MVKKIVRYLWLNLKLVNKKIKFPFNSHISFSSKFEGQSKIGHGTYFVGSLGYGSYIGSNCLISGSVGRFCSIASNVKVIYATHPIQKFVSTHPVFYSLLKQNGTTFVQKQGYDEFIYVDPIGKIPVKIGNDVWIGDGVTIMGGVTIGDGAVVLTNSTITKDVPPYAIVGGLPARIINTRFDEETINLLLQYRWWDLDINWLKKNHIIFQNINAFVKTIRSENENS